MKKGKKEFPPISPLMAEIKAILDKHLEAPRYDIVTGKTVAAAEIEQLFLGYLNAKESVLNQNKQ